MSQDVAKWGVSADELQAGTYRKNAKYLELKRAAEESMVLRLERQFPGLTKHVAFKESSTPLSHNRFTCGGTAYGLAATPDQFMNNRHGNRGPVGNLFLCVAYVTRGVVTCVAR